MDSSNKYIKLYWSIQHKKKEQEKYYQSIIQKLERKINHSQLLISKNKTLLNDKYKLSKNMNFFILSLKNQNNKLNDKLNQSQFIQENLKYKSIQENHIIWQLYNKYSNLKNQKKQLKNKLNQC